MGNAAINPPILSFNLAISVMATINIAVMIILKIIKIIYLFPTHPQIVSISPLRVILN